MNMDILHWAFLLMFLGACYDVGRAKKERSSAVAGHQKANKLVFQWKAWAEKKVAALTEERDTLRVQVEQAQEVAGEEMAARKHAEEEMRSEQANTTTRLRTSDADWTTRVREAQAERDEARAKLGATRSGLRLLLDDPEKLIRRLEGTTEGLVVAGRFGPMQTTCVATSLPPMYDPGYVPNGGLGE